MPHRKLLKLVDFLLRYSEVKLQTFFLEKYCSICKNVNECVVYECQLPVSLPAGCQLSQAEIQLLTQQLQHQAQQVSML